MTNYEVLILYYSYSIIAQVSLSTEVNLLVQVTEKARMFDSKHVEFKVEVVPSGVLFFQSLKRTVFKW